MLNSYFGYVNFIQGGIHTMKKRFLSIALTLAMVSSMAVGCGSSKSDSADSKKEEGAKAEASADTESNQILFNGSSTLAPVITSMATTFFDTYGTWDAYDSSLPKEDIAIYVSAGGSGQGTKAVIDGTATFGMVARSVKDEEKEAIKDEKEYQVGIDALTIAVNPANPVNPEGKNIPEGFQKPACFPRRPFPDRPGQKPISLPFLPCRLARQGRELCRNRTSPA